MAKRDPIDEFLEFGFLSVFKPRSISADEKGIIQAVLDYVDEHVRQRSRPRKYDLGLAIDFTLLAQRLSNLNPGAKPFRANLTEESLFQEYRLITERGGTTANTHPFEASIDAVLASVVCVCCKNMAT